MVITHNLSAMNIGRQLNVVEEYQKKSAEHLSTGYRINRASDDAAGLTISENMRFQIRGLNRASHNIEDAVSLIQVADGALSETHSVLQRIRELSVQAANETNTIHDRNAIQKEVNSLLEEVDNIATKTTFNSTIHPLLGDLDSKWQLPVTLANSNKELEVETGASIDGFTIDKDGIAYGGLIKYTGVGLPAGAVYAEITKDGIEVNYGGSTSEKLGKSDKWNSLRVSALKVDSDGYIYFE